MTCTWSFCDPRMEPDVGGDHDVGIPEVSIGSGSE